MGRIKRLLLKRKQAERENRRKKRRQKRREFYQKTRKFILNKSIVLKKIVFNKEFLLASFIFINSYIISKELSKINARLQHQQVEITRLKIQSKLKEKMENSWYSNINWPAVLFVGSTIWTKLYKQEEYIYEQPKEETQNKPMLTYHTLESEQRIYFIADQKIKY